MASLSADPAVSALAADRPVYSTMSVTTEATGARSGVARHRAGRALHRARALASRSSTRASPRAATCAAASRSTSTSSAALGRGRDFYGHGTHIAGIIAGEQRRVPGGFRGMAPGAHLINLRVLARGRQRQDERRPRGHRLGDREQGSLQHPRAEHLARSSGDRSGRRRSAGAGGRACRAGRHRGGLLGGQPGQDAGRQADDRRDQLAGQLAERHHGRRAEHSRARRSVPTTR